MTFTQIKTIYLDCSVAVPMPSSMPAPTRLEFAPVVKDYKDDLLGRAFSHKNLFLSSPFCFLCSFIFLQNSYSALYFPHATELSEQFFCLCTSVFVAARSRKTEMP